MGVDSRVQSEAPLVDLGKPAKSPEAETILVNN